MTSIELSSARDLDAADPLAGYRDRFVVGDPGLVYLDGNSLGRLPRATAGRLQQAVDAWGDRLIRGWSEWIDEPHRVGDLLGSGLLGAAPGQVAICDSTSINLYKLAHAAVAARPGRRVIVTDDDNFPTDLYVLRGVADAVGGELRVVHTDPDDGIDLDTVRAALDDDVALLSLSHVAYRSGALADMAALTAAAHDVGALTLWDLSHSAGAVPVALDGSGADLAVGCTYKYLNAGPGAPAFLYVRADLQASLTQPIHGWFGQRDQFAMAGEYDPEPDLRRFLAGTPPVLGIVTVEEGVRVLAEAGMDALRAKSTALTSYLIELVDALLPQLRVATPRDPVRRGGHVTLHHPDAWRLTQALVDRGVIPDYRTPERIRFGLAPLTTSYEDVWRAVDVLRDVLATRAYESYDSTPGRVT